METRRDAPPPRAIVGFDEPILLGSTAPRDGDEFELPTLE
jgi:hypothetical protein